MRSPPVQVAFQEPKKSEHEEQNEDKLDYHDRLKVMTSDCTVDLELHAMAPTAKLEVRHHATSPSSLRAFFSPQGYQEVLASLTHLDTPQVEGNLDFGIVTQESSAKRTLRVRNNGHKEAQFELECDVTGIETKVSCLMLQ